MVKHIVFWNLKDFAEGNDKEANLKLAKEGLEALVKKLPLVKCFEFGRTAVPGPTQFDVALYMEFDSMEDLETYLNDPDHQKFAAFAQKIRTDRAAVDYIV